VKPRRAMALDPGIRTGWARTGGRSGVLDLSGFDDHGHAIAHFEDWLDCELKDNPPDLLLIERCLFSTRMRGVDLTIGLMMAAHAVAWSRKVPRSERMASDVRQRLLGDRRATDSAMSVAVSAHGFRTRNPHCIDAAALLIVGMST
jgi:hypothetical protein